MTNKAEYIAKMQAQLDKLAVKMETLETAAHDAKETARIKYREEMAKLRQKTHTATTKLEELKASGEESWDEMVSDMEKMHESLSHAFFSFFQPPQAGKPEDDQTKTEAKRATKDASHARK